MDIKRESLINRGEKKTKTQTVADTYTRYMCVCFVVNESGYNERVKKV